MLEACGFSCVSEGGLKCEEGTGYKSVGIFLN